MTEASEPTHAHTHLFVSVLQGKKVLAASVKPRKREKMSKDELEEELFTLFGEQQHWHFTQIQVCFAYSTDNRQHRTVEEGGQMPPHTSGMLIIITPRPRQGCSAQLSVWLCPSVLCVLPCRKHWSSP